MRHRTACSRGQPPQISDQPPYFTINPLSQGVFLLNAVLTVRAHEANSHAGKGWEALTDAIVAKLNAQTQV